MFASRLLVKERSRARQLTVIVSVAAHACLGLGLWVYSYWKISKLSPREVPVLMAAGLPRLGDDRPPGAPKTPGAVKKPPPPKDAALQQPTDKAQKPDPGTAATASPTDGPVGDGGKGPGRPDGIEGVDEDCPECIPGTPRPGLPTVDEVPDAPVKKVEIVPQDRMEGRRIAGDAQILLPQSVLARVASEGKGGLVVGARVCVDARGNVASVTISAGSGFADVDSHVERGVRAWRFEPWQVAGEAVPVCFGARFHYTIER